ncbi:Hsp20/alpha crystallin family protein [Microbulbifer thermotolerans]|uniref:Hsp20/alpha crystallin family protein n=1 Tax=Microbulbifer thermotolerans TaxID=252514 RepID=A0AB35HV97_MICTH|nr:Hsp20/alpha crystallin family protein [Microbulbifer thermotolerans]MCX2780863.1 Hsp20/alpha crystallin family protein [Microbulbifer thermotolerans]MCX2784283.1 Hsp20/alpha crystallin family protein [Microbulbifer thermotolerans]MCX2794358.1 Hsp20/alpha crystallin family protein [Microbulbifer thermotolerans]MCX2801008.1 Hsp20/alpha crystallin family protein [Microbulbifer thermotolerans]MCX2804828.1 Hsp20/alpha crystallin family protein [Microbulbifer thermotolerans]
MSLIPRGSLFDLDNMIEQLMLPNRVLGQGTEGFFSPRIDVCEHKDSYEISAELPGVSKEHINVTLENGVLTLEAETHRENKEEKEGRVIREERRYGKFLRSFNLGEDVSEKEIDANFKDGVLTLKVPKREEVQPQRKRIEIH